MTNYSRSVLLSNGLHRPENLPVKFGFSPKSTSTNIAKKLPLQRCFKPLLIALFNFSHKRPTFAFTSESGYTLAFRRKIAHKCLHAETGAVSGGVLLLPSERSARSQTSPGRVSERQVLPLLGFGQGCSQRTQKAFGTAMRLCASLFRGVAAPLGCVIFFASAEVAACTPCAQCFPNVRDEGWYHYPRRALRAAETPDGRLSKRLICRFLASPIYICERPCRIEKDRLRFR